MFDSTYHIDTVQVGETKGIDHMRLMEMLRAIHQVGMRLVTDEADRRIGWDVFASQDGRQILIIEPSQGRI